MQKFRMVLHNVPHCKRTGINRKLYLSHSFILTKLSISIVEVWFSIEDSERLEKYNCFLWDFFIAECRIFYCLVVFTYLRFCFIWLIYQEWNLQVGRLEDRHSNTCIAVFVWGSESILKTLLERGRIWQRKIGQ